MIDTSLSKLPLHQHINEPELVFAGGNVSNHPLRGLCKYGPYSLDLKYLSQISIATLTIKGQENILRNIIHELCSLRIIILLT